MQYLLNMLCLILFDEIALSKSQNGLMINGSNFTLNHRNFRILSGSLHYFRIPSDAWEDRLLKLKAMGLNTVDIYIPWNLHEPQPGVFDFEGQFDLVTFLKKVKNHGLYAIVRPGPYICSEWDLGGLPAWLLRDRKMKLRSLYHGFIQAVMRYFKMLFKLIKVFQFGHGGPIIAFQIENEYGSYGKDSSYMRFLKKAFERYGLHELLFVSDNESGLGNFELKGVLNTVNFMEKNKGSIIKKLDQIQPNRPLYVAELWCGWFDHWGEKHHVVSDDTVTETVEYILQRGGSLNLYMLHGGTNFGFMNGANADNDGSNYKSTVTSYDYNAPISEYGRLTKKYDKLKKVLKEFAPDEVPSGLPTSNNKSVLPTAYGNIFLQEEMSLMGTLDDYVDRELHKTPVNMENLNVNNFSGQSYGYTLYKTQIKKIPGNSVLNVTKVIINDEVVFTTFENFTNVLVQLDDHLKDKASTALYLLVENCGRVNYGILGPVFYGGRELINWRIYPLEFKREWVNNLATSALWKDSGKEKTTKKVPKLYKGNLYVHKNAPSDTNLILPGWFKGAVFVNGYNMGRYWNRGPQLSLFLPGLWLRGGDNTVVVFDLHGSPLKYEEHFPVIESGIESYLGDMTMFRI